MELFQFASRIASDFAFVEVVTVNVGNRSSSVEFTCRERLRCQQNHRLRIALLNEEFCAEIRMD